MDIAATLIELLQQRAPNSSIGPSDVARALTKNVSDWRALMQPVRDAAAALARQGRIVITQGETQLNPDDVNHGPIRLRRGPAFQRVLPAQATPSSKSTS